MKLSALLLGAVAAIGLPAAASAKTIVLDTKMKSYGGNGAYLAVYLTDAQGRYDSTLLVAGRKARYFSHLREWARGAFQDRRSLDGLTGASVGSGQVMKVSVEVADALLDAGYQIRIDSSVEDGRDFPAEVVAPLATAAAGKAVAGKGYVQSFSFTLR